MAGGDDVAEHQARVLCTPDAPLERAHTHPAVDNGQTKLQPADPPEAREPAPPRGAKEGDVVVRGAVVRRALRRSVNMYSA